ncbi:hypothetical protein [Metabacillus arenae]|uniref:DUF2524 family protein n=1 Tax=Metabacillus arenae TaxID=2771434 RepID=A0A926RZQ5_9BACI|nr:hypothetical protein [Metabacillus arenae]MBD1383386.1 hypothetical protein [Metabacillus arenae]
MSDQTEIKQLYDTLDQTFKAVEKAQGYSNPQKYQEAEQQLAYAQQLVLAKQQANNLPPDEHHKLSLMLERLRHLQEIQSSIQQQ